MRSWAKLGGVVLGLLSLQCTFYTRRPGDQNAAGGSTGMGDGSGGASPAVTGVMGSALPGEWAEATGNLVDVKCGYGNLTLVSSKPDEDVMIAGISEAGLWRSAQGGDSWTVLGSGKNSAQIPNRPAAIVYDPEHPRVFWEAGPYGTGVFRTDDNGVTLKQLGDARDVDLVAIDFTDSDRQTLLTNVHESRTILRSSDGGEHWDDITASIPNTVNDCSAPLVLDGQTHMLGCGPYGGKKGGIIKTTDGGESWELISDYPTGEAPLIASDGSIYWSVQSNGGLIESKDKGETWTYLVQADTVHPIELPDGRIATLTSDFVVLSDASRKVWRVASPKLPFKPVGVVYSAFQRAFYIWHISAEATPPADAIARFDFDYETQ